MATPDQYETRIHAIRDAALVVSADGSTSTGTGPLTHVTATSTRKFIVKKTTGQGAHAQAFADLTRQQILAPYGLRNADGAVIVSEGTDDILIFARIRKA